MTRDSVRRAAAQAALVLLVALVSAPLFYILTGRPASDLSIHATWAAEGDFSDLTSFFHHGAHPMWHVLVALVMLAGVPLAPAAAGVTALLKAAEVWLIYRLLDRRLGGRMRPEAVAALAFALGMAASLLTPLNPAVYAGVGSPNTWHSPTQLIAMVWMLLCVPYTARCFDRYGAPGTPLPWREGAALGLMLLCSLAAKPTFMQVFLPAACLFFLYHWIGHPGRSRCFLRLIACVLPAVALMILQYMYYFGIIVPSQGDMVLEISLEKLGRVALSTLLIQAFPLYVAVAYRREKGDTLYALALVMDAVGVLEYLLLGENGRRAADGNFGWGMMGAALLMWVVAAARFFDAREAAGRLRRAAGLGLLTWHVASGAYYVFYLYTSGAVL